MLAALTNYERHQAFLRNGINKHASDLTQVESHVLQYPSAVRNITEITNDIQRIEASQETQMTSLLEAQKAHRVVGLEIEKELGELKVQQKRTKAISQKFYWASSSYGKIAIDGLAAVCKVILKNPSIAAVAIACFAMGTVYTQYYR